MYDVTIDLAAGLAILVPDNKAHTALSVSFYRVDFSMPGCALFFDEQDQFKMALPWTSVNVILFEKL